jgi:hypothetical protein
LEEEEKMRRENITPYVPFSILSFNEGPCISYLLDNTLVVAELEPALAGFRSFKKLLIAKMPNTVVGISATFILIGRFLGILGVLASSFQVSCNIFVKDKSDLQNHFH